GDIKRGPARSRTEPELISCSIPPVDFQDERIAWVRIDPQPRQMDETTFRNACGPAPIGDRCRHVDARQGNTVVAWSAAVTDLELRPAWHRDDRAFGQTSESPHDGVMLVVINQSECVSGLRLRAEFDNVERRPGDRYCAPHFNDVAELRVGFGER